MMHITIYHNPRCGTSRNTLALIRHTGVEPQVIEYLQRPLTKSELQNLVSTLNVPVREMMRQKEAVYMELQLDDPKWDDDALLDHLAVHPILLNRPIVVTSMGAKVCRPCELVLDILPTRQLTAFQKEDGEIVINEHGERVR
ncbi:arsenate reductase (glutaredoxin) [Undibacterium fentianense]|uniref:Arsenate reductase n=1 Tax=Undibacterium fentianense TaxID=2828728 RepID=A0A941E364_9BURK|nr:arsenate reductase (glutaredoxin) [Undibacterium fentianense]MBR7799784.1 arsenate reductase (glutaredoxin) [Undibacterium fentianense]